MNTNSTHGRDPDEFITQHFAPLTCQGQLTTTITFERAIPHCCMLEATERSKVRIRVPLFVKRKISEIHGPDIPNDDDDLVPRMNQQGSVEPSEDVEQPPSIKDRYRTAMKKRQLEKEENQLVSLHRLVQNQGLFKHLNIELKR